MREQGEVELPADALITPAAEDWLRSSVVPVRRAVVAEQPIESEPVIYVVGDAHNPVLQTLLPALQRRHQSAQFLPCNGNLAGLLDALRRACEGLAACSRQRGVVLVRDGAIANCVANKCAKVCAVIVSRPSAPFELVHNLGMNLMILETGRMSLRQLQATIDGFLAGKTSVDPEIEAALAGESTLADAGRNAAGGTGG